MSDAGYLRERARQCWKLAELATEEPIKEELRRLAREFQREALLLDIRSMTGGGPDGRLAFG